MPVQLERLKKTFYGAHGIFRTRRARFFEENAAYTYAAYAHMLRVCSYVKYASYMYENAPYIRKYEPMLSTHLCEYISNNRRGSTHSVRNF